MTIDPVKYRQASQHKHDVPLMCCAFDSSGRFVLAGGRDRGVVCLDIASSTLTTLDGHETWIGSAVRAGPDLVLTSDYAGRVIAWNCSGARPEIRWNIAAHASTIYALAVNQDGTSFATGDREGTIRIWQTCDGRCTSQITGLEHPVYGLALHPDGKRLVSADRRPKVPRLKLWELMNGQELSSIDVPQFSGYRRVEDIEWGGIRAITLAADGNTLVACGRNEYSGPACALLFDVSTGELKRNLASTLKGFYYSTRFHPQGFLLTAGGDIGKGEVRAWDSNQDDPLLTVSTPGPCTAIDVHPDGRQFIVSQMNGKGSYPDSGSLTFYEFTE